MANDAGLAITTGKICRNCSRWLPLEEFARNRRMHFGRHSWCRDCVREATREWRANNRGYIDDYNKARRIGPRERECVDCGSAFTAGLRGPASDRCPDCRRQRKIEQRRTLRDRRDRAAQRTAAKG
jgi:hypothetical protein